ncbi:MAG: SIMPL domain-containing protein [Pseudomonadota bacterium]|nr:SIMPL domain-containing protein [Pseudomonadota bacterium]
MTTHRTSLFRISIPAMLLLTAAAWSPLASAGDDYIEVQGNGEVRAMPDYISLSILVSATAADARTAKQQVDDSMKQLLAMAADHGIDAQDIDAARITNQPLWEWSKDGRQYRGEQVSRNVVLTLRQLDDYTRLSHELMGISHLSLNTSALRFNDRAALEQQARTLALHDARDKARSMAAALDTRIGDVVRITEQGGSHTPLMEMRALSVAKSAASPAPMLIQEQSVTASVQVRFELDN